MNSEGHIRRCPYGLDQEEVACVALIIIHAASEDVLALYCVSATFLKKHKAFQLNDQCSGVKWNLNKPHRVLLARP